MRRTSRLLIILALLCMACFITRRSFGATCGQERWAIKTLQDAEEGKIQFDHVQDTTVLELIGLSKPRKLPENKRIQPTETTLFRIHALFKGYKHESDSDLHMVIADPSDPNITMIAEVPASRCANPTYSKAFDTVRRFLLSQVGRPRGTGKMLWLPAPVPVVITGVGFFDKCHGQTGRAPNCIELHPVIDMTADFHGGHVLPSHERLEGGSEGR
jgi:hypothetical protein